MSTTSSHSLKHLTQTLIGTGLIFLPLLSTAQTQTFSPSQPEQRQREQLEQQQAEQQRQQQQRSRSTTPTQQIIQPQSTTQSTTSVCFKISRITWSQPQGTLQPPPYLQMLASRDATTPDCLKLNDIQALQTTLSNALIEHGHITSKLSIPPQNIATGVLTIDWYPGTVGNISYDPAGGHPIGGLAMLFPNRASQLYNQRQFDQSLENLKRLSSQGRATIELQAGAVAGTSNVVYKLEPTPFYKRISGTIGIDNAGGDSTGQYQLNGSLSIDSPLHLNDQLTLNYNRNADANNNQHHTKSSGATWDIATGYGTFGIGYNQSKYLQTVPGYISDLAYQGKSQDFYASAGFILHRNTSSKTQASFKIGRKISHNFIDQTEIPIQMRDYVYTDAGINHTQYHKDQQYTLGLNVRQSLPNRSKASGFIYGQPDWNGKWRIYSLNASASIPFTIKQSHWKYSGTLKAQSAARPTPASELFSLGSRYTVRGFDETFGISAEDGLLIRNEMAYLYGANQRQQVYLGIDWGKIKGPSTNSAMATSLTGIAIGVRGAWHGINYDIAAGLPLKSPEYYKSKHKPSVYGTVSYQF